MARPTAHELTERELEVMHQFWKSGDSAVAEVRDALAAAGVDLAQTTVGTLVRILVEKGFLEQSQKERPARYRPIRSFEEVSKSLVGNLLDRVFLGSCTNGRIEDLRAAAAVVQGKKVAATVSAMVVPGSGLVKEQAEAEGLDVIFKEAGFDWREPGCSMCLAMNADKLKPQERCASTSNRNFEGRQGFKGRTHLVSPAMAAAAAVTGHFVDIREWPAH